MNEQLCESFTQERPFLLSLALKIVGSCSEAEDLVEETFLRWQSVDPGKVESARAYLATILTRLCINHLKSARVRREVSLESLPAVEPAAWDAQPDFELLGDSLSEAFQLLLGSLSPNERLVFILRDVFEFGYEEIASLLETTAENCRQMLRRARGRITAQEVRFRPPQVAADHAVTAFLNACHSGQIEPLLAVLSDEVVLTRDAGDLFLPAPPPLSGKESVANWLFRLFSGAARGSVHDWNPLGPGTFLVRSQEEPGPDILLSIANSRISSAMVIRCPARKKRLRILSRLLWWPAGSGRIL